MSNEKKIPVKAYTPKELRDMYGVSWKVFNEWRLLISEKIGPLKGRTYTPAQVQIMIDHWGQPE